MSGEAAAMAQTSEHAMAREGGVPGTRSEEDRRAEAKWRARVAWLEGVRRECGSDEQEFETARTKPTWTEISSASSCSVDDSSFAELERLRVENQQHFQRLLEEFPLYSDKDAFPKNGWDMREGILSSSERGWMPGRTANEKYSFLASTKEFYSKVREAPFFWDFEGGLEVGCKIGEGGQAEIYEALFNGKVEKRYVLKVFPRDMSLVDLQRQWLTGISHRSMTWKKKYTDTRCCFTTNGILLKDGRFAFLMQRYWGDLRKAIDLQMVKDKTNYGPPFPLFTTAKIMHQIACGVRLLHENDILHRDLKAANVLLMRGEQIWDYDCYVADFESSKGVMGTAFWRAPEVLLALKNKVEDKYSNPEIWTKKVDVFSYAMTCYEVLTGCIPFGDHAGNDYDGVIGGERPPLPDYIDPQLQELVRRCWHSEPSMRPTFDEIEDEMGRFIYKRGQVCKRLKGNNRNVVEASDWIEYIKHHYSDMIFQAAWMKEHIYEMQ